MTAPDATLSRLALFAAPACCEDETWRPLPGWPHQSSTCGRVLQLPRLDALGRLSIGGILPQTPDRRPGKGYLYVMLRDGKRVRKAAVAVVVLESHCGPRPGPGFQACHGNGNRTDNHRVNLRWDTIVANRLERERHRLERAVTAGVTGGPDDGSGVTGRPFPQDGACPAPSRYGVTGDGANGTVASRIPSKLSFSLSSVQPVLQSLRSFRRSH